MLSITGLHNFYFLPGLHDMRCKAPRIFEIIRAKYQRDHTKVKMIHYENHAYYVHEKCFSKGYKFVKIVLRDDVPVYKIEWKSLVSVLESPVIKSINLQ